MGLKVSDPIGDAAYGPLLVRLPLGLYLVHASLQKIHNPKFFLDAVESYGKIHAPFDTLYGLLMPYIEFLAGVLILLGFWTTLAGILAGIVSVIYFLAFGAYRNLPWGKAFIIMTPPAAGQGVFPAYVPHWDVFVLVAALSLLYSGPGALSIDRFRKSA